MLTSSSYNRQAAESKHPTMHPYLLMPPAVCAVCVGIAAGRSPLLSSTIAVTARVAAGCAPLVGLVMVVLLHCLVLRTRSTGRLRSRRAGTIYAAPCLRAHRLPSCACACACALSLCAYVARCLCTRIHASSQHVWRSSPACTRFARYDDFIRRDCTPSLNASAPLLGGECLEAAGVFDDTE